VPSTTNSYVGICALAQGGSERHVAAADKSFGQRGGLGRGTTLVLLVMSVVLLHRCCGLLS